MLQLLIPLLGNLFDKLFPDPAAAAAAKLQVMQMAQSGELAQLDADLKIATGQIAVNQVEAGSASLWVSGWRPAVGWCCAAAFGFKFLLGPLVAVGLAVAGHPITLPVLDYSEMSTVLMGMLGIGGLRTIEKIKGVA